LLLSEVNWKMRTMKIRFESAFAFCLAMAAFSADFPTRGESPEQWYREGREAVARAKQNVPIIGKAKNVILFIGDGMGITTVTAARILEGQQRGGPGEENFLSFEKFPNTALIKTYNTDAQTADSAGTMSAIVTGVKTCIGYLSVNQNALRGNHASAKGNETPTILELAEKAGLSTGVVTTTRVTHATPAACYAHVPERDWEDDSAIPPEQRSAGAVDIARQLIEFRFGDGLEVVLGGGRGNFLPELIRDPENEKTYGRRQDQRNLAEEWLKKPDSAYVWNKDQFLAIDAGKTKHLLGLFEPSHMKYEHDRKNDRAGEPDLADMTTKAIAILSKNDKGYFLMVEGGRIDHAHHENNAFRALTDTIEFARAVAAAREQTKREDTLIIVTADHSHVFTMCGYPTRGNPILGKVTDCDCPHDQRGRLALDARGLPFTTLGYGNGPGCITGAPRPDLTSTDTGAPDYRQEAAIPMVAETHSGEDVPLYADGPNAYLFHGVLEQNVIFHVMADALGLAGDPPKQ
jgi:alkaline phosphatase